MANRLHVAAIQAQARDPVDFVRLDLEARRKRRHVFTTAGGERVLLDWAKPPELKDGNGLELSDGRVIEIRAEAEALIEIETDDPVRIAWHLGNRHLPTQIVGARMRIRDDHVIAQMLDQLGCRLTRLAAPFDPEGGAYGHHHEH